MKQKQIKIYSDYIQKRIDDLEKEIDLNCLNIYNEWKSALEEAYLEGVIEYEAALMNYNSTVDTVNSHLYLELEHIYKTCTPVRVIDFSRCLFLYNKTMMEIVMSSIDLKDVSDIFPDGNVWTVLAYTYSEKDLGLKLLGLKPRIEDKKELFDLLDSVMFDDGVDKVVVKAEGKFFKDMNKSVIVYTKIKSNFKVLPKVGESIRYKDCDECDSEVHQVIAIDSEHSTLVVKHVYQSFGERIMYYGIPFSEYFNQMELVQ